MPTKVKKRPLKKKTLDLLNQIKAHIREEPRRLAMGAWGIVYSTKAAAGSARIPPCGTVACIAGWAILLSRPELHKLVEERRDNTLPGLLMGESPESAGRAALDITHNQSEKLFFTENWPKRYSTKYVREDDRAERAKIAILRINAFIRSQGAE